MLSPSVSESWPRLFWNVISWSSVDAEPVLRYMPPPPRTPRFHSMVLSTMIMCALLTARPPPNDAVFFEMLLDVTSAWILYNQDGNSFSMGEQSHVKIFPVGQGCPVVQFPVGASSPRPAPCGVGHALKPKFTVGPTESASTDMPPPKPISVLELSARRSPAVFATTVAFRRANFVVFTDPTSGMVSMLKPPPFVLAVLFRTVVFSTVKSPDRKTNLFRLISI